MRRAWLAGLLLVAACERGEKNGAGKPQGPDGPGGPRRSARALAEEGPRGPPPTAPSEPLVLLFGGDVDLGRALGRRLVKEPDYRPFTHVERWLRAADVRFANLESPLSDQRGELQSPHNPLVFNGPPHAAKTLAAAGIDIVSTANNHAFDYGESGILGTLESLRAARVESVGTGPSRTAAEEPLVLERGGRSLAFVAGTDVWNQGASLPARGYVADADGARLIAFLAALERRAAYGASRDRGDRSQNARLTNEHRRPAEAG